MHKNNKQLNFKEYIYGAFLGLTILILPSLLLQQTFNLEEQISLICFSISLPFLVYSLLNIYFQKNNIIISELNSNFAKIEPYTIYPSLVLSYIGITILFFNSNNVSGFAFVLSSLIILIIEQYIVKNMIKYK